MSLLPSFDHISFQRKVQLALKSVERALELERKPQLAEDVDHTYGAKYGLVDLTSNAAIIAYMNCLEKLGLDALALKSVDKTKPTTLRFEPSIECTFLKEVKVDVPVERSYEVKEETTGDNPSENKITKKVMKAVNHVTEFHWEVELNWSISIYAGTSVEDRKVIKSRTCKTTVITQSSGDLDARTSPIELSLSWLLRQIDTDLLNSQFKVDTEAEETRTPRRNEAVESALEFASRLGNWCEGIGSFFHGRVGPLLRQHNPALPKPNDFPLGKLRGVEDQHQIFNPILPLMEDTKPPEDDAESPGAENNSIICLRGQNSIDDDATLLSTKDMSKLLNEHVRTLSEAVDGAEKSWPSDGIPSSFEATLLLICGHMKDLASQYVDAMSYTESMMENQLIAAIGKRLTPQDLDKFVKYHNARLLQPMPRPFSLAIRRPEHYPVGLLSIETKDENECIHSHSTKVNASSRLKIPLSAATVLELTGQQHLHGYLNHRFGTSHKRHQLVARARQFSSFVLVIGTMTDGTTLDPKDAIIVQNKDELLIPLLLDELPTAKEFKDAVKSLSPEQQRFARAYRKMQLSSSVFGSCVIQIKPQLEALLGLPPDSLDKEMKLTQDLMELFIEFQVPSDMLSYNGFADNIATEDKISNVKDNVKSVMDVIGAEKEKQLKAEQAKTEMAMEKAFQQVPMTDYSAPPPPPGRATQRQYVGRGQAPQQMMQRRAMRSARVAYSSMPQEQPDILMDLCDADAIACEMESISAPARADYGAKDVGGSQRKSHRASQQEERKPKPPGEKESMPERQNIKGVDFTLIPQTLDAAVEKSGGGNALRSTTIKTGDGWIRNRQENLLSSPKRQRLDAEEIKKERNKAFDLLDALSRSGSLQIAHSDLHVVVAVTHCFDKDVMRTVVCDDVNPIEKLERSTLLLASAVHGVPARGLIRDASELQRLEGALPLLLGLPEND